MNSRNSDNNFPEKIPLRPITNISRETTSPPDPQSSPLSLPASEAKTDRENDPSPLSRDQRARASALPKTSPPSKSRLISSDRVERHIRRKQELRKVKHKRRRQAQIAVIALLVTSFCVGFFLKTLANTGRGTAEKSAHSSPQKREEALKLMDVATQAKHDGRSHDAIAAARAAQQTAPDMPGANILLAELALEARRPKELKLAAEESLRRGQNPAEAKLLLALEKWMTRGTGVYSMESIAKAKQLLTEAFNADPSNMTILFFRGDIESFNGNKSEAQNFLLGALHRQQPWLSSALLTAKMHLAADETAKMPKETKALSLMPPQSAAGDALVALRQTMQSGSDLHAPLAILRGTLTERQLKNIFNDQAFQNKNLPAPILQIKTAPLKKLPGEESTENHAD